MLSDPAPVIFRAATKDRKVRQHVKGAWKGRKRLKARAGIRFGKIGTLTPALVHNFIQATGLTSVS